MVIFAVPSTPVIDVDKCSRSVHSVVLVLCSPEHEYDVIDEYRVYYNSQQEEMQGIKVGKLYRLVRVHHYQTQKLG